MPDVGCYVIEGVPIRSEPLRILILADANSIHTEQWVRGLADTGSVELRLVTMNPAGVRAGLREINALSGIEEFCSGPVNSSGGNWRYLMNVPRVVAAVRRIKPDAIVAIYLSSYGLIGAIAKGDVVLAHVVIGSDVMITPGQSWSYSFLARHALARGDLFVSASEAVTSRLLSLGKIPPEAILTQQYGLEDWVIGHPFLPKTYNFVSNRAWVPNSQIPLLLRVFASVPRLGMLALVGDGPPLETEIRQLVSADPRVVPLGRLPHRQNVEVVARSAFYISMTASDGASLSLMEAMAVGAIPVVSDIEPNREWVEHDVNGVLLPLDDELAAVSTIESLLSRPDEELNEMRRRNREIIRERGSLSRNMARFRDRLGAVLAQR
jgi:glycosyltransferase involved in cell wall biosynthesis